MMTSEATSCDIAINNENVKVRPLDSIVCQAIANKRPKPRHSLGEETAMDVDRSNVRAGNSRSMHPDDILTEMVRSGNYSQEQVVQFCIQMNIPISRMLRLDLMRSPKKRAS